MRFEINVKKDIEMAEIIGTVTSIKRYLSPEKIELNGPERKASYSPIR